MASLLGEPNQRDAGAADLAVATAPLRKLLLAGDHVAETRAQRQVADDAAEALRRFALRQGLGDAEPRLCIEQVVQVAAQGAEVDFGRSDQIADAFQTDRGRVVVLDVAIDLGTARIVQLPLRPRTQAAGGQLQVAADAALCGNSSRSASASDCACLSSWLRRRCSR